MLRLKRAFIADLEGEMYLLQGQASLIGDVERPSDQLWIVVERRPSGVKSRVRRGSALAWGSFGAEAATRATLEWS